MEVFAHQSGGNVDNQGQHHQYGGDGEGHIKLALLLGVDIQGHGQGSTGALQRLPQAAVQSMGEACCIQQRRRLAQNTAHRQNAALELRENIKKIGAQLLGCAASEVDFDGKEVYIINPDGADNGAVSVSLSDIATKAQVNNTIPVDVTATYSSPVSPPPYMVGMVEIELDKETGAVKILDYQAVVDCGIPVNPNLARVQTEGGIGQGIGMALYENVTYNAGGKIAENDFMQYKIPTRQDVGHINVEFETSYEPSGPFGVKSIGEIVINTPAPALAHAIYRATGVWHRTVPFTPEKILMGMADPDWHEKDLRVK